MWVSSVYLKPLNKEKLSLLRSLGFKHIQISLDSINEDTLIEHLNVTKGYLDKITNTMELLDEMNFEWQVNTVITKWNSSIKNEIKPLLNYLLKFKNLKSIKFSPMGFPMYVNESTFNEMRTNIDKISEIEKFLHNKNRIDLIFARSNCKTDY